MQLFAEGIDTGIVLDSGDGITHCIPVSDGDILNHSIERMDIAGKHITEYLVRLLKKMAMLLIPHQTLTL